MIEFTTLSGRLYAIQYSGDLHTWNTITPFHRAIGSRVQWIDTARPRRKATRRKRRGVLSPVPVA